MNVTRPAKWSHNNWNGLSNQDHYPLAIRLCSARQNSPYITGLRPETRVCINVQLKVPKNQKILSIFEWCLPNHVTLLLEYLAQQIWYTNESGF